MQKVRTHKDLIVWQKSMTMVIEVYKYTEFFPRSELYGLVSQIRRAAVSIPSNIAEGSRRRYIRERLQFFTIAYSSGAELETQLELANQLFPQITYNTVMMHAALEEVMKMLNKMTNTAP